MSKFLSAVTMLFVSAALAIGALAQPGPVQQPAGARPPIYYVLSPVSLTSTGTLFQGETGGYPAINFQFSSVGSGSQITADVSNDNATWSVSICQRRDNDGGGTIYSAFSPNATFWYSCETTMRYFRLRVTTYGSGTVTMRGIFNTNPNGAFTRVVGPSGGAVDMNIEYTGGNLLTADDAAAGTTVPVPVGGTHETSPPTFASGDRVTNRYTSRGELLIAPSVGGTAQTFSSVPVNGVSNTANLAQVLAKSYVVNPAGTWDQARGSVSTFNGVGDGSANVSAHGLCDVSGVTVVTENNFGPKRMTCTEHALYVHPTTTAEQTFLPTLHTLTAAATTNATNVKASGGNIYRINVGNLSATGAWLSLYNNAGAPTCGTGIIQQFWVPASQTLDLDFSVPKPFTTGIAYCLTTGIAGTGAVAATTYQVNIDYR